MVSNKTVLVTGGASGIGQASALVLAAEGARVIIADLQDDAGAGTVDKIVATGGEAEYHHVDVADYGQVSALVEETAGRHGSLDGAFNNAGIEGPGGKVANLAQEGWDNVIAVNLTGVYNCIKCQVQQMLKQENGGSIVNTSSIFGLVGVEGCVAYNAAKHGVVGITKTVALEYARKKIRVNAVCPGFIDTPMYARISGASTQIIEMQNSQIAIGRMARPSEIGEAATWLISDRSSYVTGVAMPVDGGFTAG